jgi:hypothetical protein
LLRFTFLLCQNPLFIRVGGHFWGKAKLGERGDSLQSCRMKTQAPSEPTPTRLPTSFKVAIVVSGLEYWPLAQAANKLLPPKDQMSERTISLLATDKKRPTPKQAEALGQILRRPVRELFPE